MDKTDFNMCGTSVFVICVDKGGPTRFFGRIFHYYRADPIPFSGPEIIFKEMEEVFDLSGFPQASSKLRSFGKKKKPKNYLRVGAGKLMQEDIATMQKGTEGTFVVHVRSRQNCTWQGKVVWAEKNMSQNFRSGLELLKLIDSAIDEGEENED